MSVWTEVHWAEGMFLRPHHLQTWQRYWETVTAAGLDALAPYAWGFSYLELSREAVADNTFTIEGCVLRLPGGTWLHVPRNTEVDPRPFEEALKALPVDKALDVFLGVPALKEVRPNVSRGGTSGDGQAARYLATSTERADENTGENAQPVQIRRFRGRLFFGDEDRSGYESVRVARIGRSASAAGTPELLDDAPPAMLGVGVWPALMRRLSSITSAIGAKATQLAGRAQEQNVGFRSPPEIEHLFKLLLLNETGETWEALLQAGTPGLHPYAAYVHLRTVLGRLAVFRPDRRPVPVPDYRHDDCGPVLKALLGQITELLDLIEPPENVIPVPLARVEAGAERYVLQADLGEWDLQAVRLFVGVDAPDLDSDQLNAERASMGMSIASPSTVAGLVDYRIPGLDLTLLGNPPVELPRPAGRYYFHVKRDTEYWPQVVQERGLGVCVRESAHVDRLQEWNMTLYLLPPGK
jgi:type VI secretion system protein ImpJ